jgi:amino acid permease
MFHIPFRYHYIIVVPAELSAASVLISYWDEKINAAVWITIGLVVVIVINLMGAGKRFYLIQDRVSGSSLHSPHRRLWRG